MASPVADAARALEAQCEPHTVRVTLAPHPEAFGTPLEHATGWGAAFLTLLAQCVTR